MCFFLWTLHTFQGFTDEQVLLLQSEQNSYFRTRTLLTTFEGASLRSRAPDVVQLTDWPLSSLLIQHKQQWPTEGDLLWVTK